MSQRVPVSAAARNRRMRMGGAVVVLCLIVAGAMSPALMAGKPAGPVKPPSVTYTGATAEFGCSGSITDGVLTSTCPDGVLSDGAPYTGDPTVSTARGAFIYVSGSYDDFQLKFDGNGGRSLLLDFGPAQGTPACGKRLPCRKNFDVAEITTTFLQGFLVRPANADGSDLAGGLDAMKEGTTVPAKVMMNFPDPNGSSLWYTLRYNTRDYTGSSYAYVTRTGANSWTVEAGKNPSNTKDAGIAALIGSTDGSSYKTHEGFYYMPFSLTIVR